MARYPGAIWDPLPENETQGVISPTQFIIHTAVDAPGPSNIPGYFARGDVSVESQFYIYMNGAVVQMMDTNRRADANRFANVRAISVEMEDEGDPENVPFSPAQITSLVKLILWVHQEHGVPLELCESWDSPGLGWHSMWGFADPINQTGIKDNPWSTSRGKTCPGKTRIRQIVDVILPALKEEPAMKFEDAQAQLDKDYPKYAGRKADTGGRDYWAREIADGRKTLHEVRLQLLDAEGLDRIWAKLASLASVKAAPVQTVSEASPDSVIEEIINRLEQ